MDPSLQESLRRFLGDASRRDAALISAGYQGSAYLYEQDGSKLVIKEAGGGFFTGWFHRMMLRREARIYELLANVAGVPHSPGMLDNTHLILEFIDGESMKEARKTLRDSDAFYDRLRTIISDFHAVGVGHGDLKRKDNVLVTAAEQPFVIDFGTAVARNGNLWDRLTFRLVRRFDNHAWIKAKYGGDYHAISAEDLRWYRPTGLEKTFQFVQRLWRKVTFRQARKRRARDRES
jgi:predicted Ser/Thr protein kinase